MKKTIFLMVLFIITFLIWPECGLAGDRYYDRDRYRDYSYDRSREYYRDRKQHYHRHYKTDPWAIVGAAIAGAVIYDIFGPRRIIDPYYYAPVRHCYIRIYGEWRIDQCGERYWYEFHNPRRVRVPCY